MSKKTKTILVGVSGKTQFTSLSHLTKTIFHVITNGNPKWHGENNKSFYSITGFVSGLDIVKPIVYLENAFFIINTNDEELIDTITSFDYSSLKLADIKITSISSPLEDYYAKQIKHNNVVVKTISPIYFNSKNGEKLNKDYSNFLDILNHQMKNKLHYIINDFGDECEFKREDIDTLNITYNNINEPTNPTIKPIRVYFKSKTNSIKGGLGTLIINGNKNIIKTVLAYGLGSLTSSGFGSVKVIA